MFVSLNTVTTPRLGRVCPASAARGEPSSPREAQGGTSASPAVG
jgi:hypothetical protein